MKFHHLAYMCVAAVFSFTACSDWKDAEREVFPEQEEVNRIIPFLEARSEDDLMPSQREFYRKLREEYRKSPHVLGFGWFGNWTGKGTNEQNYLKCLPDSVDFISLWGARGNFSAEQKADLKFFQEVKGCKALMCWIIQDIGSAITPEGKDANQYWVQELGGGDRLKGTEAYANAIADTIIKYNLDGFDIDYEPGYGASGTLASWEQIGEKHGNVAMYRFIKTLYDRFQAHEKETGKDMLLVMDGEPYKCDTETSKMLDYYIYQAYWEQSSQMVINKITRDNLDNWPSKTIITVEFEQCWRTGGIHPQSGSANGNGRATYYPARSEFQGVKGSQIYDYATLDIPSKGGVRVAGVGTYHMEYDYKNNPPYKWLREALYYGNQKYPGKFSK